MDADRAKHNKTFQVGEAGHGAANNVIYTFFIYIFKKTHCQSQFISYRLVTIYSLFTVRSQNLHGKHDW